MWDISHRYTMSQSYRNTLVWFRLRRLKCIRSMYCLSACKCLRIKEAETHLSPQKHWFICTYNDAASFASALNKCFSRMRTFVTLFLHGVSVPEVICMICTSQMSVIQNKLPENTRYSQHTDPENGKTHSSF